MEPLSVGVEAPDFTLRDQFGQEVTLSSYRGTKAVALIFFPFAFSGVCSGELSGIRDHLEEFVTFDSDVLGVSCDPRFALRAFADRDALVFPLLSDFWPHGEISRRYGVFDETQGHARRSTFLVDKAGVVRWSVHSGVPQARDLDEHLRQLRRLAG